MSQEIPPPRSALVDVTNHAEKRAFSLISTSGGDEDERFHLAKKECLRLDNFNNKENCVPTPCVGENVTTSIVKASVELKGKAENKSSVMDNDNNTDSNKDEYFESQESRCCGVDGDGDLMKTCRCSFCIKAGNLLSDLHYQDIKGRIAVINKSQKEASIFVNRDARSAQISNLDSDLTGRWKSLFLHMEDMFLREAAQLEKSLSTLKELTDNCNTHSKIN